MSGMLAGMEPPALKIVAPEPDLPEPVNKLTLDGTITCALSVHVPAPKSILANEENPVNGLEENVSGSVSIIQQDVTQADSAEDRVACDTPSTNKMLLMLPNFSLPVCELFPVQA
jgi:hypothetical protein